MSQCLPCHASDEERARQANSMMSEFALHVHADIADLSRSKMNERGTRANVMKLLMKTLKTESVTLI